MIQNRQWASPFHVIETFAQLKAPFYDVTSEEFNFR